MTDTDREPIGLYLFLASMVILSLASLAAANYMAHTRDLATIQAGLVQKIDDKTGGKIWTKP